MLQKRNVFYCCETLKLRSFKFISLFVSEINSRSRIQVKLFVQRKDLQAFQKDAITILKSPPKEQGFLVLVFFFKGIIRWLHWQ